jgi:hypothetical protein
MELEVCTTAEAFKDIVSYTPNDFLLELATVLSLATQGVEGEAIAFCEPTAYALNFSPSPAKNELLFRIVEYPDRQRRSRSGHAVSSFQAGVLDVVVPFWRAFRHPEGQLTPTEYRRAMRRDFPSSCIQRLSQIVSEQRV